LYWLTAVTISWVTRPCALPIVRDGAIRNTKLEKLCVLAGVRRAVRLFWRPLPVLDPLDSRSRTSP
jgi:hypothetical protein